MVLVFVLCLSLCLGQYDVQGVHRDQCRGKHEEDQQQKNNVGHGRHIEIRIDLVSSSDIHIILVLGGFVEKIEKLKGIRLHLIDDLIRPNDQMVIRDIGYDSDN